MDFNKVIDEIIRVERGYVDHPSDRGGPTNHGITQAVARKEGYQGDMKDLPLSLARSIYLKRYITGPRFDKVGLIDPDIAMELVDTGVNMGPPRATEFLQTALNAFNLQGTRYPDLEVDGRIGPATFSALSAFLVWRGKDGKKVLLRALNALQGVRYLDIATNNPSQEDFTFGWFLNRVS